MSCELIKGGAFVGMYSEASGIALETLSSEASIAILTFEKYVNGAAIQWNRIQEVKQLMVRGMLNGVNQSTDPALMQRLFLEVYSTWKPKSLFLEENALILARKA